MNYLSGILQFNRKLPKIEKVGKKGNYQLSYNQSELISTLKYNVPIYLHNILYGYKISGELDTDILESSIKDVVNNNIIFKLNFIDTDLKGKFVQSVGNSSKCKFTQESAIDCDISNFITDHMPFWVKNLSNFNDYTVNIILYRLSPELHIIVFMINHMILDGYSFMRFLKEISLIYNSSKRGVIYQKKENSTYDFIDFSEWQRKTIADGFYDSHIDYWKNKYKKIGINKKWNDFSYISKVRYASIGESVFEKINQVVNEKNVTVYAYLLSVYFVFLHLITDKSLLHIFIPVAARNNLYTMNIMGFMNNYISLLCNIKSDFMFSDILENVKEELNESMKYQDMPLNYLVNELDIDDYTIRDFVFSMYTNGSTLELDNIEVESLQMDNPYNLYSIAFYVNIQKTTIDFKVKYKENFETNVNCNDYLPLYLKVLDSCINDDKLLLNSLRNLF